MTQMIMPIFQIDINLEGFVPSAPQQKHLADIYPVHPLWESGNIRNVACLIGTGELRARNLMLAHEWWLCDFDR